ncbi:hypothetical protein PRK78_005321 [Emydomyces testavorans]|uniref:Uncharacterized protein n=1 Tax=Emydomyces testavorans TaxID=2070801 RepID=A0AAF0DN51_9EURO|nr:hypothetical protein PRK78_005321 [Emydomyces testavorans]
MEFVKKVKAAGPVLQKAEESPVSSRNMQISLRLDAAEAAKIDALVASNEASIKELRAATETYDTLARNLAVEQLKAIGDANTFAATSSNLAAVLRLFPSSRDHAIVLAPLRPCSSRSRLPALLLVPSMSPLSRLPPVLLNATHPPRFPIRQLAQCARRLARLPPLQPLRTTLANHLLLNPPILLHCLPRSALWVPATRKTSHNMAVTPCVYLIPACLPHKLQTHCEHVYTITLGPHGSKLADVINNLPALSVLDYRINVTLNEEKTKLVSYAMTFLDDMPQQQANAGFKSHVTMRECHQCLITETE